MKAPIICVWTTDELRGLHREHLAGAMVSNLAKRRRRRTADLIAAWHGIGLAYRPRRANSPRRRSVPDALVAAMLNAWMAGEGLSSIARRHGRHRQSIRSLFVTRGLPLRAQDKASNPRRVDGSFAPLHSKTAAEISAIIDAATSLSVPPQIAVEWRTWPMARRAEFITRLRERLQDPTDRPQTPFSANVIPFDYTSESAWEIIRAKNAGLPSTHWKAKLDIRSQGVIWAGKLWFWNRQTRCYIEGVRWLPGHGRTVLSRAVFEASTGGRIPPGMVIRHRDGNLNNLDPDNLFLATRNDVMRANQARALVAQSRAKTAALLNLAKTTTPDHHDHNRTLRTLAGRKL
jgi:hypothetical protein